MHKNVGLESEVGAEAGLTVSVAMPTRARAPHRPRRALVIIEFDEESLAREVAARTGETLTTAVVVALRERLARLRGRPKRPRLREQLREIARRCSELPSE